MRLPSPQIKPIFYPVSHLKDIILKCDPGDPTLLCDKRQSVKLRDELPFFLACHRSERYLWVASLDKKLPCRKEKRTFFLCAYRKDKDCSSGKSKRAGCMKSFRNFLIVHEHKQWGTSSIVLWDVFTGANARSLFKNRRISQAPCMSNFISLKGRNVILLTDPLMEVWVMLLF